MLIYDLRIIGDNLRTYRKKAGLTQFEMAELAGIADRTYTDIERGEVNPRVQTLLRICQVLKITPNDLLVDESDLTDISRDIETISDELKSLSSDERRTALKLLSVYLSSL